MTSPVSLGLVGLLAVVLFVGGAVLGQAAFGGVGAGLGLVLGFAVSGLVLRAYFTRREAASFDGP